MDHQDEQDIEIEALESIYSEELEIISRKPYVFLIRVKGSNADTRDEHKVTISIQLQFNFVETYPETAPLIQVTNCSDEMSEERINSLQAFLEKKAEENLGAVMIFTLVSEAQERLLDFIQDIKKDIQLEKDRIALEQERLDEIKYKGTPVTMENFLAWKIQFDEEMRIIGKRKTELLEKNRKLTGKQLFERDSSLIDSDILFINDQGIKVDESLFQDLDDLELEDED
ncbi:RWD domain-containing protein 1 isoform X1 [Hydra vulgaris]|uniref:RWD domain-containing protein 1 isoform X1 n=1 Tax=Hydra vulgaris TaxID=6087 RepID=UPI001F5F5691|nr:RWD domain-containing protein 1 [Hydra vulgaris]